MEACQILSPSFMVGAEGRTEYWLVVWLMGEEDGISRNADEILSRESKSFVLICGQVPIKINMENS